MTSSISSVSDLVRVIQSQFAQRAGASTSALASAKNHGRGRGARVDTTPLSALIELRVKKLEQDDPQRIRKAFRIFLESVLLAQFGDTLINDPKFYLMIDDIHAAMERDPQVKDMIGRAVAHLLSET